MRALQVVVAAVLVTGLAAAAPADAHRDSHHVVGRADDAFACGGNHWGDPRPIPHLQRQERVVQRIEAHPQRARFAVQRVKATQLGVIALVSGDVDVATKRLRGADHVVSWTRHYLSDFPPGMRIAVVVEGFLDPVLRESLKQVRGLPGRGEPAIWTGAAAVVIEWKAPVPDEVAALAGVRPNGVEVRVVPRAYSDQDFNKASNRLVRYLDRHDVEWSSVGACASAQGLELGVPYDADDVPVTQEQLDRAAGMPVRVQGGFYVSG